MGISVEPQTQSIRDEMKLKEATTRLGEYCSL